MNPSILFAIGSAIALGSAILPWQITLQKISNFQYLIIAGSTYLLVGLVGHFLEGNSFSFPLSGLFWGFLTALMYAGSIFLCSSALGHPRSNLTITATIIAAYPAVTAVLDVVIRKQTFSLKEILFLLMILGGIAGLSLSGKS